jgi:hypothetical protein
MRYLTLSAAVCLALPLAPAVAQSDRVGTFDPQSIVIAFYRSPQYAAVLREHIAARDSAKRAGDTTRVRELEAWGAAQQDTAHQQLAGVARLTNIVEALRPAFAAIQRSANVREIVAAPAAKPGVTTVDVTPQLLDWLQADARTRALLPGGKP